MDDDGKIHEALCQGTLYLSKSVGAYFFRKVDSFVTQSRRNYRVNEVTLCPYFDDDDHEVGGVRNYEIWDKIGQGVANLEGIKTFQIHLYRLKAGEHHNGDPDWEIVARILSHVRSHIELIIDDYHVWGTEDVRGLSRAIYGNPMIQRFEPVNLFPFCSLGVLCSALATLPALERVCLAHREQRTELALVNPEPLTELVRSPSLRFMGFRRFCFTTALSRAVADALREGSAVTTLNFMRCSFSEGESAAMIALALKRNETLSTLSVRESPFDKAFCDAMSVSLLTNTSLQDVTLDLPDDGTSSAWLSSVFLVLGMNTGLKTLYISGHKSNGLDLADEQLCAAMVTGLGRNSMLESLHLNNSILSDTDAAASGRNALSFLRTNTALKSLKVFFGRDAMETRVSTFRTQAASMLEQNTSLESLTMWSEHTKIEDYRSVFSALQSNTTLTYLSLESGTVQMTDEDANELTSIVKKNYGLQSVSPTRYWMVDLCAILRLNEAGRQYLVKYGSSISKGVDVLSAVSDDINCLFLHLLENPRLCDRGAVEMTNESSEGGRLPNSAGKSGKREQAHAGKGKESRRRLLE
jgi:hypothetical protein